ncbi:DinI-like family protein [Rahnella aceris]
MRVEVLIAREKAKVMPRGSIAALTIEFNKRLQKSFPDTEATVRLAGNDGLSVIGGSTIDKEAIEGILQETSESADDWFQAV